MHAYCYTRGRCMDTTRTRSPRTRSPRTRSPRTLHFTLELYSRVRTLLSSRCPRARISARTLHMHLSPAPRRSFVGWEQQIFNEEINFNSDLVSVRCCHTRCLKRIGIASNATRRLPTKTGAGTSSRTKVEGDDRCDDDAPPAEYPPDLSREPWVGKWTPNKDVLRSKHNQNRKMGRCNHEFNVCVHVDRSGAVSHWASAFAAPDVAAVEILGKAHVPSSNCTVIPR